MVLIRNEQGSGSQNHEVESQPKIRKLEAETADQPREGQPEKIAGSGAEHCNLEQASSQGEKPDPDARSTRIRNKSGTRIRVYPKTC